jgi:hypothetical protein
MVPLMSVKIHVMIQLRAHVPIFTLLKRLMQICFLCESDDVQEVEESIVYLAGNNNGTSTASGSDPGFNKPVARLGISCPVGSSREYAYDDFYFECPNPVSFSLDFALASAPNIYVCHSGFICGPEACNFAFDDMSVRANDDSDHIISNSFP